MAVDDLDALKEQLPQLFGERHPPLIDEGQIEVIHIDDPVGFPELDSEEDSDAVVAHDGFTLPPFDGLTVQESVGPGSFRNQGTDDLVPTPEAMAFYLPFHYFHPRLWGIYLVAEAVEEFGRWISRNSSGSLSASEGFGVAGVFLFAHESFHHAVEVFATRLEIAHRQPFYRRGFEALFRRVYGTDECIEEGLANAAGIRKIRDVAFRRPDNPTKREAAVAAVTRYVELCGPGYRLGSRLTGGDTFKQTRSHLAEQNFQECLPQLPTSGDVVWLAFPHAFSGIARVTSRVNYLVRRGSSLASRVRLALRYFKRREVARMLERIAGCRLVRQGSRHEIWESPSGAQFAVPRHRGDIATGTLRKIIRDAGLSLSITQLMRDGTAD